MCKRGGDIFSVCIPGNCSAALLNNETSACILVGGGGLEKNDVRSRAGKKMLTYPENVTQTEIINREKMYIHCSHFPARVWKDGKFRQR